MGQYADAAHLVEGYTIVKVAINDLSFRYRFYDWETADKALHVFLSNCMEVKKKQYHNVEGIWSQPIDRNVELAPGHTLIKLVQNFKTREQRGMLLSLLANAPTFSTNIPFCLDGKQSYMCAYAKDGAVISLNSDQLFSETSISGEMDGILCEIRNIAQSSHIGHHSAALGRRIYQPNPKHHSKAYMRADMLVSPMDLSLEDAQKALDEAIEIEGRLFSKVGNSYYEFRVHQDNCYHGYRNDHVEHDILKKIEQKITKIKK